MNNISFWLEISLIMFTATTFRTAFGFGEALISVPLLSLVMPVKVSAPVAVLASVLIALAVIIKDWRHIHFAAAKKLLIATLFGLPLGVFMLRYIPETQAKLILGIFLFGFALFSLLRPNTFVLKDDRLAWLFGFFAGFTGGSYGMNGPPLAIYGAGRGWSPPEFRATIQAYFLPASLLGLVGYFFSGIWTTEVNGLFIRSLPAIFAGVLLGNFLNRKMSGSSFSKYVYSGMILVALILLAQGLSLFSASG